MKNILKSLVLILIGALTGQSVKAETVYGNVLYQGDALRPIGNVSVVLKNVATNATQTYTTVGDGYFQFVNVADGNYKLSGTTSIAGGGVTYYDAVLVFLNLIGYYQFTPLEFLASDVNGNGAISWSDFNLIVSHILYGTPFPVGPWKFETSTFAITNLKDGVPHGIGGTCSGDVGGTFVPTVNNTPALPLAQGGVINVSDGEPFTTRIFTKDELSFTGAGIIINYPSELLHIESVEFKGADYEYNIDGGQIRLVWGNPNTSAVNFAAGESLITIHGVSTAGFTQGMTASMSIDGNTSLMNASNAEIKNLQFSAPVIKYGNPALKLSNYPNPFTSSTKLSIYTPVEGNAIIEVYSTAGQLVDNFAAGKMNAGYHEINLDASKLTQGYYLCKMRIVTDGDELNQTIRILKAN